VRDWDEPHDESAAEFGTAVHAFLAGEPADRGSAEALDLVQRFRASELGRRIARASRVEREFDFVMAIEDVVLRGQIDLWFEEAGELLLLDYKTDTVRPEDTASRAAAYALQLRLYALALERITGRMPSRAYACFLRSGQTIAIALDKPLLEESKDLVRLFREAQSSLRFDLREGEQCRRCPYYHETGFQIVGERLRFQPLVNLQGLLGGVHYHPAIRALRHMRFEFFTHTAPGVLVQVLGKLIQELITCK
jgi:CRISPR/Cas system-associated exonuclease Cas4 (RecB family)